MVKTGKSLILRGHIFGVEKVKSEKISKFSLKTKKVARGKWLYGVWDIDFVGEYLHAYFHKTEIYKNPYFHRSKFLKEKCL